MKDTQFKTRVQAIINALNEVSLEYSMGNNFELLSVLRGLLINLCIEIKTNLEITKEEIKSIDDINDKCDINYSELLNVRSHYSTSRESIYYSNTLFSNLSNLNLKLRMLLTKYKYAEEEQKKKVGL